MVPVSFNKILLSALTGLVLLTLSPLRLRAQEPLTLQECVEIALQSNKDMEAARHQRQKYEYEKNALKANYYPQINLSFTGLFSTLDKSRVFDVATPVGQFVADRLQSSLPEFISSTMRRQIAVDIASGLSSLNPLIDFRLGTMFVGNLNLTQPLYMGGKIIAGYKMGQLGVQMAELGEKLTREETVVAVHEAYLLLAKAKALQEVASSYDSLLVRLTHDVESAKRHGMVSNNDLLKVQVKMSDARLKVKQASNGVRLARMNLCQVMGLPILTPLDIKGENPEETLFLPDPLATAEGRTEVRLLELKTRLAEQQVKLERAAMLPEVGVSVNGSLLDGIHLMGDRLFERDLILSMAFSVKIPIFHAGQSRNKVLAAKEEFARQQIEEQSLREKLNLDLQQRADALEEAGLDLEMKRHNLEQSQENLRVCRVAYGVGNGTLSDLLTAQLLWQQAYADFIEAKFEQNIQFVKWQKAAGKIYY